MQILIDELHIGMRLIEGMCYFSQGEYGLWFAIEFSEKCQDLGEINNLWTDISDISLSHISWLKPVEVNIYLQQSSISTMI